jgi:hypothetical protein
MRRLALILAAAALVGPVPSAAAATPPPGAPNCPVFPADNVWNTDISGLPVNAHSAQWMASTGAGSADLHPDFGSSGDPNAPYGIPYIVVDGTHPKTQVAFQYASESDPGPYPFGADTPIEGGAGSTGDRHAIMVESDTCTLYELYDAHYAPGGSTAGSGAIWSLTSDRLRPTGWTSADAAGLPIFPGLARLDEVKAGAIHHALRFTANKTQNAFVHPATHGASSNTGASFPPMGARVRLKASYDVSQVTGASLVILTALKKYGMFLADNGSDWFISGETNTSWDDNDLDQMKQVPASAFEVVQVGTIVPQM